MSGLFISVANSIRFAKRDSELPSTENTLSYEEKYAATTIQPTYCQRFKDDDVVTVQVGSDSAVVPTVEAFQPELETASPITAVLQTSYVTDSDITNWRYYYEFDVDFSDYTDKIIQIKVTQGAVIYLSEFLKGEDLDEDLADGYLLKIGNTNADKTSDYPNFQIDYTTGIEFFYYIEAVLRKPDPQGEDEVFDNIDQKVLLEAILFRAMILETEALPKFLTEKIGISGKHFYFTVNGIQYISDGIPDVETEASNFGVLTWTLVQKDTLGFNTDNRTTEGVNVEVVLVRKKEDLTSTWTFVQPEGYILHAIYADHAAGSGAATATFKVGYTVGGTDIIPPFITNIVKTDPVRPFVLHEQKTFDAAQTIYVEVVSGAGAILRIYVNLLLNT